MKKTFNEYIDSIVLKGSGITEDPLEDPSDAKKYLEYRTVEQLVQKELKERMGSFPFFENHSEQIKKIVRTTVLLTMYMQDEVVNEE